MCVTIYTLHLYNMSRKIFDIFDIFDILFIKPIFMSVLNCAHDNSPLV